MKKSILFAGFMALTLSSAAYAVIQDNDPLKKLLNLRDEGVVESDGTFKTKWMGADYQGKLFCSNNKIQTNMDAISNLLSKQSLDETKARTLIRDLYKCVSISNMRVEEDAGTLTFQGNLLLPKIESGSYFAWDNQKKLDKIRKNLKTSEEGFHMSDVQTARTTFDIVDQHIQKIKSVVKDGDKTLLNLSLQYDLNTMEPLLESGTLYAIMENGDMPSYTISSAVKKMLSKDLFSAIQDFHLLQLSLFYEPNKPMLAVVGDVNDNYDATIFSTTQKKVLNVNWKDPELKIHFASPQTERNIAHVDVTFPKDMRKRMRDYFTFLINNDIDPYWAFHLFELYAQGTKINTTLYNTDGSSFAQASVNFKDKLKINLKSGPTMTDLFKTAKLTINRQTNNCHVKSVEFKPQYQNTLTVCTTTNCSQQSLDQVFTSLEDCVSEYADTILPELMSEFEAASSSIMNKVNPMLDDSNDTPDDVFDTFIDEVPTGNIETDDYRKESYDDPLASAQAAPSDLIAKIVADKTNYSLGNPKGKYVIIEFFDHQCGWCKKTNAAMREALAKPEAKNIRWIPIDTPIFGEASETIARYVLAAGKQGKFAAMHEAVGESQGHLDEAKLIALATGLGLDTNKLKADANSEAIKNKLVANREFMKTLKVSGVPMLIVNGKVNPGALVGDKLDQVVKYSSSIEFGSSLSDNSQDEESQQNVSNKTINSLTKDAADPKTQANRASIKKRIVSEIMESVAISAITASAEKRKMKAEDIDILKEQLPLWDTMFASSDGTVFVKLKEKTVFEGTEFTGKELLTALQSSSPISNDCNEKLMMCIFKVKF